MNHEYATDLGWAQKQAGRIKDQIEAYMAKNPDSKLDLKFYYPKFN
jgi:beta-N-acetylglucosaminidase